MFLIIWLSKIFIILVLAMGKLNLDTLKNGLPGFSKTIGSFLAEAAFVCLESML